MKRFFASILNKPLAVAAASLVVAVAIGAWSVYGDSAPAQARFVPAASSTIALAGQATPGTSATSLTLSFRTSGQIRSVDVKVGDEIRKGEVLASLDPQNTVGALTQARAAYAAASANYQKVLNGATGPTIDVARAALNTATVARKETVRQQEVLVRNAHTALLNATPEAYPEGGDNIDDPAPIISGSYTLGKEGDIVIKLYRSAAESGYSFQLSGLVKGSGSASAITPQPLGNSGLYMLLPDASRSRMTWIVSLPNQKAPDYIAKYNAYQSALQTRDQATAAADAAVAQAEANLRVVAAAARPEDVAAAAAQVESARGALQIAQAAYDQYRIIAPGDGTVTAVHVSAGQTVTANAPAIEIQGTSFAKEVAVAVPNEAVVTRDGKAFVRVRGSDGALVEKEVSVGISDASMTEIVSGISAGEQVAL